MGYTQEELGEKLGLQKSAIAKYENGRVKNIKRSVIARMAQVLDCSPSYLFGWNDEKKPEDENKNIMQYYGMLNDLGKETATEQVRLLTLDEKYTKITSVIRETDADYLITNAAHERTGVRIKEEERLDDENMID